MSSWPVEPLAGLLTRLENGSRPKGGVSGIATGVPSLGGEHINREGGFDFDGIKFVPEEFFQGMGRGVIQTEDILVVKDGATTGKTAFVGTDFPYPRAAVNEHVYLLRVDRKTAVPRFVFFFLFSPPGQAQILASFHGAAIGGISHDFARAVGVPVPPLVEQERIVRILDEAEALRRLRAEVEVRMELLIPATARALFGDIEGGHSPFPSQSLGDLCEHFGGGTPSTENPDFWSGAIPWVSPKDMKTSEIRDSIDHVSDAALRASRLRLLPESTILIVIRGMILAHTFPVAITRVPVTINQDMKGLIPSEAVIPDYLHWCLKMFSPEILSLVSTAGHGTKRIEMDSLLALRLPVPPLDLQHTFAARIAKIRELEAFQVGSRNRLDDLFQSLLHQAYKGEL